MHRLLTIVALVAIGLAACNGPPVKPKPGRTLVAPEAVPEAQLPRDVVPRRYRISLTVNPASGGFSGHTEIDVVFRDKRRALFVHGNGLNVLSASVRLDARHSIPAHYAEVDKSGVARLLFVDAVPAGKATLVFDYEAPYGKYLEGLYKVVEQGTAYAFTQFEASAARMAFPSFDEPGFKTPFQLSVTAPSADKVISNSPVELVSKAQNGMNTTLFEWTPPLPTYLIALAVGPFDIVDGGSLPLNQLRNRAVHLRGITTRGNGARIHYALSLTPKIVMALEKYFGVAYPFKKLDLLAVPDFAAGAMENAGAITFRDRLLLLDDDAPLDQKRSSLSVQAHEISHQWTGDLVTPAWWNDLWLNEAFADWMEEKIAQEVLPSEEFDTETLRDGLAVMDTDELPAARAVRQPVRNAGDIENAFDNITYDKGAAILAMFEGFIGEDTFRRGMHAYLTKFAYRNATAEDFIGTIARVASAQKGIKAENVTISIDEDGKITWNGNPLPSESALIDQLSHMRIAASAEAELGSAFFSFIEQPGVPELDVHLSCNEAATARTAQTQFTPIGQSSANRQWKIPACFGAPGHDTYCRLIDRTTEDVLLGVSCPVALVPNDEGDGYYRFALDRAAYDALSTNIANLDVRDQITVLYNLLSALHAGKAGAGQLLAAIRSVSPNARWDVLDTLDQILHAVRVQAGLAGLDLAQYRSLISRLFSGRLKSLGFDHRPKDSPSDALARERLATLLVSEAHDQDTISALAPLGEALVQGNPGLLAPELWGEAMRAALLARGAPFATMLVDAYRASRQEYFRRQIVYAFAVSNSADTLKPLLDLALTPGMRAGEIRYLFQFFADEPSAAAVLWSWYKQNYPAILARLSRNGMRRVPGILREACSQDARNDLDAFFSTRTNELTGTARPLAIVEQSITRCVAFRQAKEQEIAAALRSAQ